MKDSIRTKLFNTTFGYAFYKSIKYFFHGFKIFFTMLNHYKTKLLLSVFPKKGKDSKLHLGCGFTYLNNWINIDNNILLGKKRKKDIWLDITNGLPFKDQTARAVFTSHVLEHFTTEDVIRILSECYRVLKKGGCLRIVVPSLDIALENYHKNNIDFFGGEGRTVSRRFVNFILYRSKHLNIFNFEYLNELLEEIGFEKIKNKKFMESEFFTEQELTVMDKYPEESLYVECFR